MGVENDFHARSGAVRGTRHTRRAQTHLYGFPADCCCSVVTMGFRSCFRRFFPLLAEELVVVEVVEEVLLLGRAPLATCLALLMAAFFRLSLPPFEFMAERGRVALGGAGWGICMCCDEKSEAWKGDKRQGDQSK